MAGFRVFESNRLEVLLEYLAHIFNDPLPSPLDQEVIVVQSKGMERWLSLKLAEKFGIFGNCDFPFPNQAISQLKRAFTHPDAFSVANASGNDPFDPKILTWRIMKILPSFMETAGFENLRAYLGQETDSLRLLQLSDRLAKTFDQYIMYRPEWVLDWEKGKETHHQTASLRDTALWQSLIWRELIRTIPHDTLHPYNSLHKAAIRNVFLENVKNETIDPEKLPYRLSIFGLPALPPLHLEVLVALSRYLEVNLFLLNPCQEYWFDLASEKEVARRQRKRMSKVIPAQALHYETGHPLLASFGKHGAHFFSILLDISEGKNNLPLEEVEQFEDPGEDILLTCLQSDILHVRNRGQDGSGKHIIAAEDTSIQVHVCHSRMREIEVLYDILLDLFERQPDLEPGDILVMTPDIESYAPYISAVFGACQEPGKKIPFNLADRSLRGEGQLMEVFLRILGLCGSRFGYTQVLDILDLIPVQHRFDLVEHDLESIRRWVDETRIRWGIDGPDRQRRGIPEFEENSWRMGLDRLLLGYALPGKGERMFAGILPYDEIEGMEDRVLGRFLYFIHSLFDQATRLEVPRTLSQWADELGTLLERFFQPDESMSRQFRKVRDVLTELAEIQDKSGFDREIEIETIRIFLADKLNGPERGVGFLAGGVTFCTMLPMRSIPFRVVALIGMNDGTFPRITRPPGFDLMVREPRRGDPSQRDEDRYLFLETLLSAREYLIITYVGQSMKDNSRMPPSVVVSELLEAISQGFEHPQGGIIEQIVIQHRLQAFSPFYFCPGGRLFSYSEENYQAVMARLGGPVPEEKPFIIGLLPELPEERKVVSLDHLKRFLAHPARIFLTERLGIRLEILSESAEEREPFSIKGLEKYQIEKELVRRSLLGEHLEGCYPLIRAQGILPPGTIGHLSYRELCGGVREFIDPVRHHITGDELPPLAVDLEISGYRIIGQIGSIWPAGLLHFRCARAKARDFLDLWIDHLIINALGESDYPTTSLLVSSDGQWYLPPVADSRQILKGFLSRYWQGMRLPIPFFPGTSLEFAEKFISTGGNEQKALEAARKVWLGDGFSSSRGDGEDPYFHLCFGKVNDPLGEDFQALALSVFSPLLNHRLTKPPLPKGDKGRR